MDAMNVISCLNESMKKNDFDKERENDKKSRFIWVVQPFVIINGM